METRTERRNRLAAIKLRDDAIAKLKEKNEELQNTIHEYEQCVHDLHLEISSLYMQLTHEMNVNDSLVKHSHILFETLSKQQKQGKSEIKSRAIKPTYDDLEEFFKETVADATKD